MSPELETLDQLLGGDLPVKVVRGIYQDANAFMRGVLGLLVEGDGCLLTSDRTAVPEWRWSALLDQETVSTEVNEIILRITTKGARRIG